eukprot:1028380-Alexandrium_andersonii.AAC.1
MVSNFGECLMLCLERQLDDQPGPGVFHPKFGSPTRNIMSPDAAVFEGCSTLGETWQWPEQVAT